MTIHLGDCLEILPLLDADSVDSVVTDPPYGLSFMNKAWDHSVPSVDVWREVYRVMKPGAYLLAFFGTRTYHRGVVAIEDAGFEIRDQIQWLFGCLDDQTECLTAEGWKRYDALSISDRVLQWDHATGDLAWTQPVEVVTYPFSGNMVHLKNRHIDQVLTPDHRVYAKVRRHSRHPKPVDFEVLPARSVDDRSSAWQVDLPMAGRLADGADVDLDFAYLVGWWLTDAWPHKDGKAAMFSQCKPRTLAKLRAALSRYAPSEYVKEPKCDQHQAEHTFYVTGPLADRLLADYPSRELGWWAVQWSEAARARLLEGLMDGDGSEKSGQHARVFWSQSQERRDVFVALALSLGHRAYEDREKGCVHLNPKTTTSQLQDRHRAAPYRYEGEVWCLRVPTGAFVVRRNGRPFITGNSGFPKNHDVSKAIDKAAGAERKVLRTEKFRDIRNGHGRGLGDGLNASEREGPVQYLQHAITAPSTDAAKQWEGWGTALKPANEPIVVARKPLIGTVAENVLRYGTGGLNIDGCRVEGIKDVPASVRRAAQGAAYGDLSNDPGTGSGWDPNTGRWPANVIHDGSDEVLAAFPDAKGQQGAVRGDEPSEPLGENTYGRMKGRVPAAPRVEIEKSAARFFYAAKANKSDRNDGLEGFDPQPSAASEFRPNHTEKAAEGADGNPYGRWKPLANAHPTVKPTDLMRYLCRLVTPPGGTVLDPFTGSGSTGRGAALEGFNFIGIEMLPEYVAIAEARIAAAERRYADEVFV